MKNTFCPVAMERKKRSFLRLTDEDINQWSPPCGALQLGKIFQMKNVPQLISSHIRGGQPVEDCTLISSDNFFL